MGGLIYRKTTNKEIKKQREEERRGWLKGKRRRRRRRLMEEEKGERGEGKQRAPEENNRNDLTEKKKVCDEAAADFFFYVSDSASFLCILSSVSCRDNILHMVRFSLCTKTTEEEIMFGRFCRREHDWKVSRCLLNRLDILRTFADIFLCRQIWMFLRNTVDISSCFRDYFSQEVESSPSVIDSTIHTLYIY